MLGFMFLFYVDNSAQFPANDLSLTGRPLYYRCTLVNESNRTSVLPVGNEFVHKYRQNSIILQITTLNFFPLT